MINVLSGRPARCLANRFTAVGASVELEAVPDYPIAYDAAKALHKAAKSAGEFGYCRSGPANERPLVRSMATADFMNVLRREMQEAFVHQRSVEPETIGRCVRRRHTAVSQSPLSC